MAFFDGLIEDAAKAISDWFEAAQGGALDGVIWLVSLLPFHFWIGVVVGAIGARLLPKVFPVVASIGLGAWLMARFGRRK